MYFHEKYEKKKSNILKLIKKIFILKLFNFYINKKKK